MSIGSSIGTGQFTPQVLGSTPALFSLTCKNIIRTISLPISMVRLKLMKTVSTNTSINGTP